MFLSPFFKLNLAFNKNYVVLDFQTNTAVVSTSELSGTKEIIKQLVPAVLSSTCYNDKNIPFELEIINTELGHLFEHILLEKLCEKKMLSGKKYAVFSGRTYWNWNDNPYGFFKIRVNITKKDFTFLEPAILETANIFNMLFLCYLKTERNLKIEEFKYNEIYGQRESLPINSQTRD